MFAWLAQYQKAIAAVVTSVLGWGAVIVASPSGPVTAAEWLALGVAGAVGLGVYGVPNAPKPLEPSEPPVP